MYLDELLKCQEGKTLDFKRDLSSPDGLVRSIVAFANTAGGVLLVGVEDKTRQVRGVKDPLLLEERLANLITDNILPRLVPDIEVLPWRRTHVVAVRVYPSPNKPHFVKSLGAETGAFVRVGSPNRRADKPLIDEMSRSALNHSFEEQQLPGLNSEAIDFRVASELFAPFRTLKRPDLVTLRILVTHQGKQVPSVGGLLLFGKDRHQLFPDAWIQAGRFEGTDRKQILDTAEFRKLPATAIEDTIAFLEKHMTRKAIMGNTRRVDQWSLPPVAIREAIVNAVVHADYSQRGAPLRVSIFDDRLEVDSPGLLPFGLTVEDIKQGISKLRNRVIGRVFYELKLIEQWGSGIQRMTAACREAGLDDPVLEEIGIHFRVTLSAIRRKKPLLDELDRAVLKALSSAEGLATKDLTPLLGISARATRSRLLSLVQRGLVVEIGTGPKDPRRKYFLPGVS